MKASISGSSSDVGAKAKNSHGMERGQEESREESETPHRAAPSTTVVTCSMGT